MRAQRCTVIFKCLYKMEQSQNEGEMKSYDIVTDIILLELFRCWGEKCGSGDRGGYIYIRVTQKGRECTKMTDETKLSCRVTQSLGLKTLERDLCR